MVRAVEGIYRGGQVELLEKPSGLDEARVLVVFLPNGNGDHAAAPTEDTVQRVLARMKTGYDLGGSPYPSRGELYDRFDRK